MSKPDFSDCIIHDFDTDNYTTISSERKREPLAKNYVLSSRVPSYHDPILEKLVPRKITVKKFKDTFKYPEWAKRCYRELVLLDHLNHENIMKKKFVYSPETSAKDLKHVYLVTEHAGESLKSIIATEPKKQTLYLKDVRSIIKQLLTALLYLKSVNVLHRDLHPDNMALKYGHLTLLDFGFARTIDKESDHTQHSNLSPYNALETCLGFCDGYDVKADVWSVGAILCELITGSLIFPGENKFPPMNAIGICGKIKPEMLNKLAPAKKTKGDPPPEHLLSNKILEKLIEESKSSNRIDFTVYFNIHARPWMKEELTGPVMANLVDFVNSTLQFDPNERMTVEQALHHPFITEYGPITARVKKFLEALPSDVQIPTPIAALDDEVKAKDNDGAIKLWKEKIWNLINCAPIKCNN